MKQRITTEQAEMVLAETIDTVYLDMKNNFVDWQNQTFKLGEFKEKVKIHFHKELFSALNQ